MRTGAMEAVRALFGQSDEQAMRRVQTLDDERAFAQLVRRWETPLRRLGARMTGDEARGEDLAQETFVRVFARRKDFQTGARFSTWLWRIALNLCYDELRRRQRRGETTFEEAGGEPSVAETFASNEAAPDSQLIERERGEVVREALLRLPETYRTVLVLRHYENLKFREIAEVLDVPEGTVKSRMAEALTQLHRLLKPVLAPEATRRKSMDQPKESLML